MSSTVAILGTTRQQADTTSCLACRQSASQPASGRGLSSRRDPRKLHRRLFLVPSEERPTHTLQVNNCASSMHDMASPMRVKSAEQFHSRCSSELDKNSDATGHAWIPPVSLRLSTSAPRTAVLMNSCISGANTSSDPYITKKPQRGLAFAHN
ncbi:hypothetical protein BN1723_001711 [Verticillium longisporum]|uniref:Uncharacterized protein n=1 Tax=Verticillium longisporum TaxID=100787 RepID=A0A0G4KK28_VERLO|nr:hypothetical protein BN1723_001711 [Verticillium longisporum]